MFSYANLISLYSKHSITVFSTWYYFRRHPWRRQWLRWRHRRCWWYMCMSVCNRFLEEKQFKPSCRLNDISWNVTPHILYRFYSPTSTITVNGTWWWCDIYHHNNIARHRELANHVSRASLVKLNKFHTVLEYSCSYSFSFLLCFKSQSTSNLYLWIYFFIYCDMQFFCLFLFLFVFVFLILIIVLSIANSINI